MSTQEALAGVLAIDKPAGMTSHDVVAFVRRLTGLRRVGHTGTLDPFATGLLLIMIGTTTRLAEYAHVATKVYETTIILGATSTTDDSTGKVVSSQEVSSHRLWAGSRQRRDKAITEEQIQETLQQFVGTTAQIPPMYAAIKVKGKKLYEYARAGESIERRSRQIRIDQVEVLSYRYPQLRLRVTCGSGTYIRALARDIGQALHVGGYAFALQRIAIGSIRIEQAASLTALTPETWRTHLLPPTVLLEHMVQLTVSLQNVAQLKQGRGVQFTNTPPNTNPVALIDQTGQLIGIGWYEATSQQLLPRKIL